MQHLGISEDMRNLVKALEAVYPQVTPQGQAFLNIYRDRLRACAEQVRHMESGLTPAASRQPSGSADGYGIM